VSYHIGHEREEFLGHTEPEQNAVAEPRWGGERSRRSCRFSLVWSFSSQSMCKMYHFSFVFITDRCQRCIAGESINQSIYQFLKWPKCTATGPLNTNVAP